jgi:hypothetical protein
MTRKVDERKTEAALRKLRRAIAEAEARGEEVKFSDWEEEFTGSLEERLEKFGSAFRDRAKGDLSEPLSTRQKAKLGEIARKARGKGGSGLKRSSGLSTKKPLKARKPMKRGGKTWEPRVRHVEDDLPPEEPARPSGPPSLRVVKGGKDADDDA